MPGHSPCALAAALLALACIGGSLVAAASSSGGRNASGGYAALCAVGRNENRYVREWVEHHLCLGFSRIYLYDHGSEERMSSLLSDHIASGALNYTYFTGHHQQFSSKSRPTSLQLFARTAQGYAYRKCVKAHGRQHAFLGFIDLDEFLVFMDPAITHVRQLLQPFEQYAGLAVHWMVAGSNNHTARPSGSVLSSYTSCMRPGIMNNRQFKTFANTAARPIMRNPHRPILYKPSAVPHPHLVDEQGNRIQSGQTNKPTHVRAAVFHYVTKSWQDYEDKLKRGGGAGVRRDADFFHMVQNRSTHACPQALELSQRLCTAAGAQQQRRQQLLEERSPSPPSRQQYQQLLKL